MSTKIHNGYRIQCGIELLYDRLIGVAPGFQKLANERTDSIVAQMATEKADKVWYNASRTFKTFGDINPLSWAKTELDGAYRQIKEGHNLPLFDYNSEIAIFPRGKHCLILTFIPSREQENMFTSLSWGSHDKIEFFGYWDNTDPPEGVSEEEFERRGKYWDTVLGPSGVPAHRALTFQLSSNEDVRLHTYGMTAHDYLELVPSKASRARRLAADNLLAKRVKHLVDTEGQCQGVEHVLAAGQWLRTPEGSDACGELSADIEKDLPEVTVELLRGEARP